MTTDGSAGEITGTGRRHPRGAVRDGLVAAELELARAGGPDAVVLREATRIVGVVPNAAYRHFADRGALLPPVSTPAIPDPPPPMAPRTAPVRGARGRPAPPLRSPRAPPQSAPPPPAPPPPRPPEPAPSPRPSPQSSQNRRVPPAVTEYVMSSSPLPGSLAGRRHPGPYERSRTAR